MITDNTIQQKHQDLIYNDDIYDASTSHTIHSKSSRSFHNQTSTYNSSHMPSIQSQFTNQNLVYNTHLPAENIDRLQVSTSNTNPKYLPNLQYQNKTSFYDSNTRYLNQFNDSEPVVLDVDSDTEYGISKRPITSKNQQHYKNWSQTTNTPLDNSSDLYSSTSYNKTRNRNQEMFSHQQNLEMTPKFKQTAIYRPHISRSSANTEKFVDSQELFFSDEKSLVNWLCTRPDLITQAQSLLTSCSSPNKVCFTLYYKLLFRFYSDFISKVI